MKACLLFLGLLILGSSTFACSCGSDKKFTTVAPATKLIALVKVNRYLSATGYDGKTPLAMEVEIITIYKGKESSKTITVWGDNGVLCRPYINTFNVGKYYVIAFIPASARGLEKSTDYSISVCGEYWLNVDLKKKTAKSARAEHQTSLTFDELKKVDWMLPTKS